MAAEEFRAVERSNAERALRNFVETVREVARAIADVVQSIAQAVVDFFAGIFGWVREEARDIMASIDNDDDDEWYW
jgi:phage-related protein